MTKYYQAMGRVVAVRQAPDATGSLVGTLSFLLQDHLGSTVGTVDAVTGAVAKQKYWPYGAVRSGGVTQTDKQYTGQQVEPGDAALGLYNYKARFYSTLVGRFVSADTLAADGLNRYEYARNEPVIMSDPSGHCAGQWTDCDDTNIRNIITCALLGQCSNAAPLDAMVRLSTWFLQQQEFWDHVYSWSLSDSTLVPSLMDTMVKASFSAGAQAVGALGRTLDVIPQYGWNAMGNSLGTNGTWFKATFLDFLDGGDRASQVTGYDIVGADAWWDSPALLNLSQIWQHEGAAWDTRRANGELITQTIAAGGLYGPFQTPWSQLQLLILGVPSGFDLQEWIKEHVAECAAQLLQDCFDTPLPVPEFP